MKIKMKTGLLAVTVGIFFASLFSVAQAAVITVTASGNFRGAFNGPDYVNGTGQPFKVVGNSYQVRTVATGTPPPIAPFNTITPNINIDATHNYFLFTLPTLASGQTVLGAELRIKHPPIVPEVNSVGSYDSPDATETVTLWDVSATGAELQGTPGDITTLGTLFDDLGGGTSFGSFSASSADIDQFEVITLDNIAITQAGNGIIASLGGEWAIGGAVTTGSHTSPFGLFERVFRGSGASMPATELRLTVSAVPIPAAAWLFGSGLLGLVVLQRRRTLGA